MNNHNKFRLTPIALAMLTAMAPALAQQAAESPAPAAKKPDARESVVVTGYRASLESALNAKREDNGIVDVIKAEDITKFPDTNLAEALQRVPGIVIDRDAGEGRNITVRGLGLDFTRVRINGIEALATTGGTDSSGGNNRSRGFDFNVFGAELFSTIIVRKSSSADVDEGSLGATVDLLTSHPFEFKKATATVSLKSRYNDLARETDPGGAFLVTDTFFDRKVGLLLSGAYSKRHLFEEGFSTVRWDNGPSSGGFCAPIGVTPANPTNSTATTCGPAAQGVARIPGTPDAIAAYNLASDPNDFHPRLPRYGRLTHDQDRTGFAGSFQVRPAPGTLVTADYLYSKLKATRHEDFLEAISFSRTAGQGGNPQTSVLSTAYAPNGALLYGVYNGVDIRAESRYDELNTTFTEPTVTLEQEIGDWVKLNAKVGRADSKFRNPVQTTTTLDALNVNGYGIDFRSSDRYPGITYPFDVTRPGPLTIVGVPVATSGTQPSTITNTTSSEIRIRPQGSNNRNDVGTVDIAWEIVPAKFTAKGGLDYKKYSFDTFEFRRVNQNDTIFAPPPGNTIDSLTTTLTGFGRGQNIPGSVPTAWVIPDLNAIARAYNIYCNCLQSGPAGGPGDFTLSSITNGNARGNNRTVTETDRGAFLMADFASMVSDWPLRGNFGVRYVQTHQVATGYQATAGGTQVTVEQTYSDVLPSLNLALNVTRDFIVRLAAAKVMARPQLGNLSPGGSISTTGNLSITVGNPFLKPFRAKTLDSSFEWYFDKNAFLGVGLFYKKIDTYIQSLVTNIPYNQTGLPLSLLPSNFNGTENFQVTTPVNTNGGNLTGYEINYQQPFTFLPPGVWRNFGTLLNYTYVDSKINYLVSPTSAATINDNLLNLSPKSWNATLYYDDGRFTARVSAAYREAFLTRVPGQNNNDVEGKNSSTNVDASMSYRVNNNVMLTLEGVNLTNQVNDQFISRARNSSVVYNVTGREYLAGVRVSF
jgi:iron complex outermembrane recepter protein